MSATKINEAASRPLPDDTSSSEEEPPKAKKLRLEAMLKKVTAKLSQEANDVITILHDFIDDPDAAENPDSLSKYRTAILNLTTAGWHSVLTSRNLQSFLAQFFNQLKPLHFYFSPSNNSYHFLPFCRTRKGCRPDPNVDPSIYGNPDIFESYSPVSTDNLISDSDNCSMASSNDGISNSTSLGNPSSEANQDDNSKMDATQTGTEPTESVALSNTDNCPEHLVSNSADSNIKFMLYFIPPSTYPSLIDEAIGLDPQVTYKLVGNYMQFVFKKESAFRCMKSHFEDSKIPFRFSDPSAEKPLKFLIRGLPPSTPVDDILDGLREVGLNPLRAVFLKHKLTKAPMPLFMVVISPTENASETIEGLTYFCQLPISIKRFVNKKPQQCYRCMGFYHGSFHCNLPIACLLCSANHSSADCPHRGKPDNFKCKNCGQKHAANWHKCPKNPANLKKSSGNQRSPRNSDPEQDSNRPELASTNQEQAPPPLPNPANQNPLPSTSSLTWAERTKRAHSKTQSNLPRQSNTPKQKIRLDSHSINRTNASSQESSSESNSNYHQPDGTFLQFIQAFRQSFEFFNLNEFLKILKEATDILNTSCDISVKCTSLIPLFIRFTSCFSKPEASA